MSYRIPAQNARRDRPSFITLLTIFPKARSLVRHSARLTELKRPAAKSLRQR